MGWISKLLKINDEKYDENDIDFLIKKAKEGDKDAIFDLAIKYSNGDKVNQNFEKAIELYIQIIDKDIMAKHNLGLIYCQQFGEDIQYFKKGVELLQQSSKNGFGPSHCELMKILIIGLNMEQNHSGALYHLYQAIKFENYKCIDYYYTSIGMVKNIGLSIDDPIHILENNSSNAVSVERQIITDRTSSSKRWRIKEQYLLDIENSKIDKVVVEFDDDSDDITYFFDITRAFENN